jgi:hypothetical protein
MLNKRTGRRGSSGDGGEANASQCDSIKSLLRHVNRLCGG